MDFSVYWEIMGRKKELWIKNGDFLNYKKTVK